MTLILNQILRMFAATTGNMIYSVLLGLSTFGALIACLYAKDRQKYPEAGRMQRGLIILLVIQLTLFAAAWMVGLGVMDGHAYLPVIDRILAILSLVMIIWLWAYPNSNQFGDAFITVLELVILLLGAVGVVLWLRESSDQFFNSSGLGGFTYYSGVGLVIIGIIILLGHRPSYWGYGILTMLVFLIGYLGQYYLGAADTDFAWSVHLGEAVGFLLLLVLPIRLIKLQQGGALDARAKALKLTSSGMNVELIQSAMSLMDETSPQQYYQGLTQLVAKLMNGDFCLLMMPPKTGDQLIVPVGYNQNQDKMIDGFTVNGGKMPLILEAIKSSQTLRLMGGKKDSEARTLAEELAIKENVQLIMVPFIPKGTNAVMGITVLSRLPTPPWSEEDAQILKQFTDTLNSRYGQSTKVPQKTIEQGETEKKLEQAQAYADQVRLEYAQLKAKYDSISAQAEIPATQTDRISTLVENQKSLQENVNQLETRNRELENLLVKARPSMEEVEQLRQELQSALADLARIPSTLSKSDQQMLEMQLSAVKHLDELQPNELVNSFSQEFRQSLASISGYTDLLLRESAGLLGAMQRKFLERVRASSERMGILLNELAQIMSIDSGRIDQTTVSVDLKTVINEAVGDIAAQLSERNINMRLDLPENLPMMHANKDALQQILANLLQNACLVTPAEGEIQLIAKVEQRENEPKYMLLSVTDQGGGIDKADISRVFLRRYKMENPLIHGVGDTGVGLAIVKSLVELYKGRVWVDTKEGSGSTFSVLIPFTEEEATTQNSSKPTG